MSNEKIEVYIEIGPNLKDVITNAMDNMQSGSYSEVQETRDLIDTIFVRIKDMVTDLFKIKKEKEIYIECPTLEKKEDQS
jgi:hypothetical protein